MRTVKAGSVGETSSWGNVEWDRAPGECATYAEVTRRESQAEISDDRSPKEVSVARAW